MSKEKNIKIDGFFKQEKFLGIMVRRVNARRYELSQGAYLQKTMDDKY